MKTLLLRDNVKGTMAFLIFIQKHLYINNQERKIGGQYIFSKNNIGLV